MATNITWILQNQFVQAVFPDGNTTLRNLPMYNNDIKVNKNASTKISLQIRRMDRKELVISRDRIVYLNVINEAGDEYLLRRMFTVDDPSKGRLSVVIQPIDLVNVTTGRYYYSITYLENELEYLLHTTTSDENCSNFIVTHTGLPSVPAPFIQRNFTRVRTYKITNNDSTLNDEKSFISSRMPLHKDTHLLTVNTDNYVGKLLIQGSNVYDPNDQVSWEDIFVEEIIEPTSDQFEFNIDTDGKKWKFIRLKFVNHISNEGKVVDLTFT